MNNIQFGAWLDAYAHAWNQRDAEAATALCTPDATYQETPFDPPLRGHAAIRDYWSDVPRHQAAMHVSCDILSVDATHDIVHWAATQTRRATGDQIALDGICVLTRDSDNRCSPFAEWWHRQVRTPVQR